MEIYCVIALPPVKTDSNQNNGYMFTHSCVLRPKPRSTELNDIRLCELYDQSFHCQQIEAKTRRINGSPGLQGAIKLTTLIQRLSANPAASSVTESCDRLYVLPVCLRFDLSYSDKEIVSSISRIWNLSRYSGILSIGEVLLKFIFHIHAIGVLWRNIHGEMVTSKENLDVALG